MPKPTGSHLRPSVLAAREKLAEGREKLKSQHDRGSPGIQVCTYLTELLDGVLGDLYRAALNATDPQIAGMVAMVPVGGYGRRDVAPYSDVDLMLLHRPGVEQQITPFVRHFTQDIFDAGLQLGFSLRTPQQACALSATDATIFTSLVEARFLGGTESIFTAFERSFSRATRRRCAALIEMIVEARRAEQHQYGETVYLLEPNIKRSKGGLRDLHLLRWIGFARYQERDPEELMRSGRLLPQEQMKIRKAHDFLLRLRNELHFRAGRAQDVLSRDEQLRIAERFGYPGDSTLLPVERFLRDYIENTSELRYTVKHFVADAKARPTLMSLIRPILSHHVDGDFRVDPVHIAATRRGLEKVRNDLAQVLRLMDLANRYNNRIDHATWRAIREAMINRSDIAMTREAAERFLSLISQPGLLGDLLRRLHELRVLEKIIPPMAHARALMQFNAYHKYTVDEHSIRAVEAATQFLTVPGPLGDAYRGIKDKRILHLALLIHDLGKGYEEDHSEIGRRLAWEITAHLGMTPDDQAKVVFLVHKHLLMSHLAQRRNINDDEVVVQFAVEVGSPELLQMLYVMTCADLAAVGPEVLNSWKLDLFSRLYQRAREQLAGDASPSTAAEWLQQQRDSLRQLVAGAHDQTWWSQQIESLPASYLADSSPEQMAGELERLRCLPRNEAVAWGRYLEPRQAVEYTIGTYEQITPGIFHKLTGALTSKGLQILSAEIHTLAQNLVLDRFFVQDTDFSGEPPPHRVEDVVKALVASLRDESPKPPTFRRLWNQGASGMARSGPRLPTRVHVDNTTSDQFTILDIFAHDRMGLLYIITRTIFQLGLSVHVARIGTYLDQVVDVFYVTDQQGRKILDDRHLNHIREQLKIQVDAFIETGVIPDAQNGEASC
jgi:[protein-PII] uridylyltransferase